MYSFKEKVYLVIVFTIGIVLAVRGAIIAFGNPELTQTQVFLKMFGL
jgi:hypothetical protein